MTDGALEALCVFCGSKHGDQVAYTTAARKLGATLAERGIRLVYGGGNIGLMGEVASATMEAGGEALGVIPQFMVEHEIANHGLTELRVVESMHDRKTAMAEVADAFLALPGGWGTVEELMEITTWAQLGLHEKPVGALDVAGFFASLVDWLDHATAHGFIKPANRGLITFDDDLDRLLATLDERVRQLRRDDP